MGSGRFRLRFANSSSRAKPGGLQDFVGASAVDVAEVWLTGSEVVEPILPRFRRLCSRRDVLAISSSNRIIRKTMSKKNCPLLLQFRVTTYLSKSPADSISSPTIQTASDPDIVDARVIIPETDAGFLAESFSGQYAWFFKHHPPPKNFPPFFLGGSGFFFWEKPPPFSFFFPPLRLSPRGSSCWRVHGCKSSGRDRRVANAPGGMSSISSGASALKTGPPCRHIEHTFEHSDAFVVVSRREQVATKRRTTVLMLFKPARALQFGCEGSQDRRVVGRVVSTLLDFALASFFPPRVFVALVFFIGTGRFFVRRVARFLGRRFIRATHRNNSSSAGGAGGLAASTSLSRQAGLGSTTRSPGFLRPPWHARF